MHKNAIRIVLLAGILAAVIVSKARSVEILKIDLSRDPKYLPYELTMATVNDWETTRAVNKRPIHAFRGATTGRYEKFSVVTAHNAPITSDLPGGVTWSDYPGNRTTDDNPIWLAMTDTWVLKDRLGEPIALAVAGYQHDSAFVLSIYPGRETRDTVFLDKGTDRTGNGTWNPEVDIVTQVDYDYDGSAELFVYINSSRDLYPRTLVCLDMERHVTEWSLPIAATVGNGQLYSCHDSLDPGVLVVSYNPGQGARDSIFDDNYAYFTRVNRKGEVVFNFVTNIRFGAAALYPTATDSLFYLAHAMPLTNPTSIPDSIPSTGHLSIVSARGRIIKSINLESPIETLRPAPFSEDGNVYLYATTHDRRLLIFDSSLTPVAQSDGLISWWFSGKLPSFGEAGPVLVLSLNVGFSVVVTPQMKLLARLPDAPYEYVEPLEYDREGHVRGIVAGGGNLATTFNGIRRRSFGDYISVVYLEYQNYFLAVFSALLATVVVVNVYRTRTKRDLVIISQQKTELEEAHRELREAQATIIAQEKYRQAKDIAGGFAHEIRNALFPADAALEKLRGAPSRESKSRERDHTYIRTATEAISRAIGITRLISQYTKLDSEYLPEPVNVAQIVRDAIRANIQRIEEAGVEVKTSGPDDAMVEANARQLYMVVNNLVLNSLDALTERANGCILIYWKFDSIGLTLTCEDNGCGIAEEDVSKVFDTFYSTKPSTGTGLGLAMVKKIVELYGGTVSVSSTTGKGARFDLTLKLHIDSNDIK